MTAVAAAVWQNAAISVAKRVLVMTAVSAMVVVLTLLVYSANAKWSTFSNVAVGSLTD
jgi:hypothetical protein